MTNNSNKFAKKSKIKLFLYCFLTAIILFSAIRINEINTEQTDDKNDYPNLSANEIIINTPENKTYTEPMSGYYPATYGFEDAEDGANPSNWEIGENGGTVNVIASMEDHNKVVEIHDTMASATYYAYFSTNFTDQSEGTIEWWWRTSDASKLNLVRLRRGTDDTTAIILQIDDNKFQYYDGATLTDITGITPLDNIWYHMRLDFNCSTDTIDVYIDGILRLDNGNFRYTADTCFRVLFRTQKADSNYYQYVDAVGFSWDPNYNSGSNLNEGLLLSYTNTTTLDWTGYSLNGQTNKTIIGNTTISFPTFDGVHTIQLFCNNSIGTRFQSDIRYFTTQIFNLITPENTTYSEPMTGYYPATYGFENDANGSYPMEWSVYEHGGTVNVISDLGGHNKVVELHDTDGGYFTYMRKNFTAQTEGKVEWWWRITDATETAIVRLRSLSENALWLQLDSDKFQYYVGDVLTDISGAPTPQDNTWMHMRIDFDCDSDTFDLYIDEELIMESSALRYNVDEIVHVQLQSSNEDYNYYIYVDAVSFSWDPNYNIGDNLKEGLLISYNTGFTPDWQGYSLDGQAITTILGNTTIPFPTHDGVHTIQVFGNNSGRVMYESNIRYFTIDTTAPIISGIEIIIELEQYSYYSLDWNISDISGGTYTIFKNSSIESAGSFQNNDEISIIVDTTEVGYTSYTIIAVDLYNKTSSHTVIVKIISQEQQDPNIPGFNVLILFAVASITTGIIIKSKFKNKK